MKQGVIITMKNVIPSYDRLRQANEVGNFVTEPISSRAGVQINCQNIKPLPKCKSRLTVGEKVTCDFKLKSYEPLFL